MATIQTKKDRTHTEEQEQDVVDPDYDDDFRDPEAEESSQEWRYRPQR